MKKEVTVCDQCKAEYDDAYDVKGSYTFMATTFMATTNMYVYRQKGRRKDRCAESDLLGQLTRESFFCNKECFKKFLDRPGKKQES